MSPQATPALPHPSPSDPAQASPQPTEVLAGSIERVTFHNAENGFCVLRIKARGHRDLVTVVGHAAEISAGEWVTVSGTWVNSREHGQQFKASFLRSSAPTTAEGIEKYLGSGMIRGIGPIYASKLVAVFGDQVFEVIEQTPERLREVPGIGPVRGQRISQAWADQKVVREIMVFLHSHGVGTARAVRIFKTYGNAAVQVMAENPYRLARDIRGIGFRTADAIAGRLGIEPEAMIRLRAGVNYALLEASGDGHCGLPAAELLKLAGELLAVERPSEGAAESDPGAESVATSRVPMEPGLIQSALDLELAEGSVVADELNSEPAIFLSNLHRDERRIAESLQALAVGYPPWGSIEAGKAIPWVEQRLGLELAVSQKGAVEQVLSSKVLVITGGPGVGKTTLINAILRILAAKKLRILLCAPTGRAAKRMGETTGLEAKTIHRLLEFDPAAFGFKRNAELPLACDLLVVDETSMVDVPLMASLLDALPPEAALLLVGDVDQLPSVGPGQVLADLINSGALPVARLTEVFRQAASSRIITTAHAINAGTIPDLRPPAAEATTDFYFLPAETPEQAVALILKVVGERIPARFGLNPIAQVQVLCPMARGGCGSRSLNIELQQLLNPDPTEQVERFGWRFAPADKVMQVANDYEKEVFNGDVGTVETIDADASELTVRFDGREVTYGWGELDNLVPAYACTIHKSQGSEYPAVVIPLLTQHYAMLQRNLVYTGITRGKQLVVLVGQKKALAMAVKNHLGRRRYTKLVEWMGLSLRN
ncbi:ATP-dependent RecD-like DNA helicase [Synechococcus sp. Cruz-9H2]|uniref:SF1B family DNA helicase RecD2 n=1 Tax=unclassified Synechococcus TaxID=2626047 RepID=UPI0020CD853A|nr:MULTISPECIES: ATP-dependent RecD-like DNA helicase [unclassified Synechococcus]MCP9820957.1 ATP-dependent RecD-like DNA helicase [Synechococcus sp. Cruz-9H2]MCP9845192.1 ATP-dependent RecD-like DNA helicase [Synechococcus sp. Edmonson 11F2]MCP9857363.1 ATP-dependent RecD-like DNA helicase [Synechococcus sp. Cruz-9C9]MCP9864608.1 ATP-dependent RecD-like DNA helicase [Synechococcus sp. Cruz-7E5]MCP9871878.1 ATP-dependent RecD-like DNA helicase [Synechococcus sp. Cruz-7B9]